jgi:DNA-binding transcriptional ArsR family regulator
MRTEDAAACLEALGNPLRLSVFRLLVRAGPRGLTVGQVQAQVGLAGSTLSHHLAALARVGVIRRHRAGSSLICTADYGAMRRLIGYLEDECCADAGPDR